MKIIIILSVVFAANYNEILSQEIAANCPKVCTLQYAPVCGKSKSDGTLRTFGNSCEFNAVNCQSKPGYELYCKGACPKPTISTPCPADIPFSPVCAKKSDGTFKEFSNYCLFEAENQSSKGEYTWIRNGTCVEKKPIEVRPQPIPMPAPVDEPIICRFERPTIDEKPVAVVDAPAE